MSAIAVNRTFEFNPESGQKHENPAKIPRKLLVVPSSISTDQNEFARAIVELAGTGQKIQVNLDVVQP